MLATTLYVNRPNPIEIDIDSAYEKAHTIIGHLLGHPGYSATPVFRGQTNYNSK